MKPGAAALALCVLILTTATAAEQQAPRHIAVGKLALPGEPCEVKPRPGWTTQEQWAWTRICEGKVADFNDGRDFGGRRDPKSATGWRENRVLRPEFLETVLTHEPYRSSVPRRGVHISGAWFRSPFDLSHITFATPLFLIACRFDDKVDLSFLRATGVVSLAASAFAADVTINRAKIGGGLALHSARFNRRLALNSIHITGDLYMHERAQFGEVTLVNAKIDGAANMSTSTFAGDVTISRASIGGVLSLHNARFRRRLALNSIEVQGDLYMHGRAQFGAVSLLNAKIDGDVDMSTSTFADTLNMQGLRVARAMSLREISARDIDLLGAQISDQLNMVRARVAGKMRMNAIQVGGLLSLRDGATFTEIDLTVAKIGRAILTGSTVTSRLVMNSLEVRDSLLMNESPELRDLDLTNAKVGVNLEMSGSRVEKRLDMTGIYVGGNLLMRRTPEHEARFAEVSLHAAKVRGSVDMTGSHFSGVLNLNALDVGGLLLLIDATLTDDLKGLLIRVGQSFFLANTQTATGSLVRMPFSDINGNLNITGSLLPSLDLTGARIRGVFQLSAGGRPSVRWHRNAELGLRGANVEAVDARHDAWPSKLQLDGFQYRFFTELSQHDVDWFIEWLGRQAQYSPQPYQQISDTLRRAGHAEQANAVLYAAMDRERSIAPWRRWVWLTMLKYFIGYGYDVFWPIATWVIALTVFGAIMLRASNERAVNGITSRVTSGLEYSFDVLLPIIQLRRSHYDVEFSGWVRYYFYFHKLMGWVLASFLVAGVSGLIRT